MRSGNADGAQGNSKPPALNWKRSRAQKAKREGGPCIDEVD